MDTECGKRVPNVERWRSLIIFIACSNVTDAVWLFSPHADLGEVSMVEWRVPQRYEENSGGADPITIAAKKKNDDYFKLIQFRDCGSLFLPKA